MEYGTTKNYVLLYKLFCIYTGGIQFFYTLVSMKGAGRGQFWVADTIQGSGCMHSKGWFLSIRMTSASPD